MRNSSKSYWNPPSTVQFLVFILLLFGALGLFLAEAPSALSLILIILVDLYAFVLLVLAAMRKTDWIPNRLPALLTIPLLFGILVISFAALYVLDDEVTWRHITTQNGSVTEEIERITDKKEALYFSLVTITTYGSNAAPEPDRARLFVALELLSGALLLLMIIPILAARLSMFEGDVDVSRRLYVEKADDSDWTLTSTSNMKVRFKGTAEETTMEVVICEDGRSICLQRPS